jgi:hypothetical protein
VNPDDVRAKVDHVRAKLEEWKRQGRDPRPVYELMVQIEPLMKQGRPDEALAKLDQALEMVDPGYTTRAGSGSASGASLPPPAPGGRAGGSWTYADREPLIDKKRQPAGLAATFARRPVAIWNDPSVLIEDGGFSMWASLGSGGGRGTMIFKLRSTDGLTWRAANGGEPVLEPGGRSDFDWYGVETPAVIKVGDTYHMAYTAYHDPDPKKGGHLFTMGTAVSKDGVHWRKQGELRPLTDVVGRQAGNPWGWLARAEPAWVYHDGLYHLYFTDVRCRKSNCKSIPSAERGISLARSRDGVNFEQVGDVPVLLQTRSYPASEGWEGYSTPWVYHDGTFFQLYVDLFRHTDGGHFQTRISHYRSRDGVHFEEVETDIVKVEGNPWAHMSVRAPTVVESGGKRLLWYAGDSFDPHRHKGPDVLEGRVRLGIGLATSPR